MAYNSLRWLIDAELPQLREEGREVSDLAAHWARLKEREASQEELAAFYQQVLAVPTEAPYAEPSELPAILAARPDGPRSLELPLTDDELADRIHAAWLGRSVGCVLGKPVEGWSRAEIQRYLAGAGAWPLTDYIPYAVSEPVPDGRSMEPSLASCRGRITRVQRDDDIDFTILGLHYLERFGRDFTAGQVGEAWLELLPYARVYTAERVAYKNLVDGLKPPATATHRNPYREWIGAQIRADAFGYVNPGQPAAAAAMAYRDAALSHCRTGLTASTGRCSWRPRSRRRSPSAIRSRLSARRSPKFPPGPARPNWCTVETWVVGFGEPRISDLARRTMQMVLR